MKPYLIIDIDGTLRPHPAGESVDPSAAVTILPAQADQLRSMSDRYELVWATMRDHAVSLQLALGLGVSFQTIALAWTTPAAVL